MFARLTMRRAYTTIEFVSETHPMDGFEFQAVLLLLMRYVVFTGNKGFAATEEKNMQADPLPATASAVAS